VSEKSDQKQIIDEAKGLNPDVPDSLVEEVDSFLNSDLNKTELSPSSLKQLSEKLLKKLEEPIQAENHIKVYKEILDTTKRSSGGVIYRKKDDGHEVYLCNHQKNGHVLPKGGINPGETIIECAIREMREETGYDVLNPSFSLGVLAYDFRDEQERLFSKKVYFFAFEIDRSQEQKELDVEDGELIEEGGWYSEEEAKKLLTHESEKDKIALLFRILKSQ